MTNIIDNNSSGLRNSNLSDSKKSATASSKAGNSNTGGTPAAPQSTTDKVDISTTSEKLHSLKQKIDETPEVDMNKVEIIKNKIASGEYPIDAERIASKFIDLEGLLS